MLSERSGPGQQPDEPHRDAARQPTSTEIEPNGGGIPIEAAAPPPPLPRSVDLLRRASGVVNRHQAFRAVQRTLGNAAAARLAMSIQDSGEGRRAPATTQAPATLQRHPAGATVLPQAEAAAAEAANPGVAPPAPAAPPTPGGAGGDTPPPAPAPAPSPAPSTAPGTAGSTTAPAPANTGAGGPTTAPVSLPTLQLAFAERALQTAFGRAAGRPIIRGSITVVQGEAALLAACDTVNMRNNANNPLTGSAWVAGDAKRTYKDRGLRLNGFADPNSPDIWVDDTSTDPTTTVHEMLHINTSSGFRGTVGEVVNEGVTQRLAVQAVRAAGQSVAGSESTYASEQGLVTALIGVVGEGTVTNAYFNGPEPLILAYEALQGSRSWAALKRLLDASPPNYTAATALLQPPSATQKIAAINALLDWWVSDDDLTAIEGIFNAASDADKQAIRTAIQPRIRDLTSIGQRTRLRVILGVV